MIFLEQEWSLKMYPDQPDNFRCCADPLSGFAFQFYRRNFYRLYHPDNFPGINNLPFRLRHLNVSFERKKNQIDYKTELINF